MVFIFRVRAPHRGKGTWAVGRAERRTGRPGAAPAVYF